jgi:hypothetical protein
MIPVVDRSTKFFSEPEFRNDVTFQQQSRVHLVARASRSNVPETSRALMSRFSTSRIGDTVRHESLIRGQHYYAQLLSAGPVSGGQSVVVEIGTRTWDNSSVQAVEVHAKSNLHWFHCQGRLCSTSVF